MNDFIGSPPIVEYLSRMKVDTLPHHAFLFVGPDHIGKTYLANAWINNLGIHERVSIDSSTESGSHATLTVKQVRDECLAELTRTSFSGSYRVVLINRADDLSEGASNALLKSLEEPPPRTLFIILATDMRALLSTIVSRCFFIRFSLVSDAAIKGMLKQVSDSILKSACHRPGIAIRLMGNNAWAAEEQSRVQQIRFRSLHSFSEGMTQGELDESDTSRIESFLSHTLHDEATPIPMHRVLALFDGLSRAQLYMRSHIPAARALESVFL